MSSINLSFLSSKKNSIQDDEASAEGGNKETALVPLAGVPSDIVVGGSVSMKSSAGDDDSTMATPRSLHTKDEFDDPDFNEVMEGGAGSSESKFLGGLSKFLNKQAKAFVRNFIDYGPPYTKKPFDPALVNECSKPVMNHMELHKLLNNRMNPNLPDPEDLYYYPIHWCARNIHFMALKMLCRAGAKLNVTNELGCSPLDMCVMMKLPPDKRKDQLKMATYLLEHGADPNNRDKGGFSAIDQAAINQNLEMIELLLEFGANVMRENHILVAKRHHILRHVYDPECYRVLYERLIMEQGKAEEKRIIREKMLSEIAADKHHVKLLQSLDKRKQKRLAREAALDQSEKLAAITQHRHKHLAEEMEANLKTKEQVLHQQGVWVKDDVDHWTFNVKDAKEKRINSQVLYDSNLRTMTHLRETNGMARYNERWKAVTGHEGGLEMHWTKSDAFTLLPPIPGTPFQFGGQYSSQQQQQRVLSNGGGAGGVRSSSGGGSAAMVNSGGNRGGKVGGDFGNNRAALALLEEEAEDHLQLTAHEGKNVPGRDAHGKGGILKQSAYKEQESSALEKHAFGGMFVGQTNANNVSSMEPVAAVVRAQQVVTKRGSSKNRSQLFVAVDSAVDLEKEDPYLEEARRLPNVDVQYADSDDEQLFDEDLESMLHELTKM